jgi:hypothetical protein
MTATLTTAAAGARALAQPHVTRPTRLALGLVVGLIALGFGTISHGFHVVSSGPDLLDVTGVGMVVGGALLAAAGLTAGPGVLARVFLSVWGQAVRGLSGMREAPSLLPIMPRIARPVLMIAGGVGAPEEIPANRAYRGAAGPTAQLWELPDAGHTGGLRTHPAAYAGRTLAFLHHALDPKETP